MARPPSRHPTELELEILKILWIEGPLAARDVRERLAAAEPPRDLAATSVVTMLNIMVDKGYLTRKKQKSVYVFRARVAEQNVSRGMLHDLVDRVFYGSATAVMLDLLETTDLSEEEIRQLRQMIRHKAKEQPS